MNLDQDCRAIIPMDATMEEVARKKRGEWPAPKSYHRTQAPKAPIASAAARTARYEVRRTAGLTVELSGAHAGV